MQPLRFGILSTGNIARQFAQGVRAGSTRCTLTAVASRDVTRAAAFADEYGIASAAADYGDLIKRDDVDAVYLGLPNAMHADWTIRALEAGKHVLCEKPLAATRAEAKVMFEVARTRDRVLIEAFMYRAHPQTQAILEAIRNGAIGTPHLIRTAFCFNTRRRDDNIRFDASLVGGALMDIGCYCLDFACLVAGRAPTSMQVHGHVRPEGVDDFAAGLLDFGGAPGEALLATFQCGMTVQADNTAMICGDEGYITTTWPWKPNDENAGYTINRQIPPRQDQNKNAAEAPEQIIACPAGKPLYAIEADAFAATVLDGAESFKRAEESIALAGLLEDARRQVGLKF